MNYYNPYYYMMNPASSLYGAPSIASRGLFSRLANSTRKTSNTDVTKCKNDVSCHE